MFGTDPPTMNAHTATLVDCSTCILLLLCYLLATLWNPEEIPSYLVDDKGKRHFVSVASNLDVTWTVLPKNQCHRILELLVILLVGQAVIEVRKIDRRVHQACMLRGTMSRGLTSPRTPHSALVAHLVHFPGSLAVQPDQVEFVGKGMSPVERERTRQRRH